MAHHNGRIFAASPPVSRCGTTQHVTLMG